MGKELAVVIILLILSFGGLTWAHGEVSSGEDDIRISERVILGDPSLAEGMEISMHSKLQDILYWSTTFWPGTDRLAESEFDYRDDSSVNMDRVVSPYDVRFEMSVKDTSYKTEYSGEVAFDNDGEYAEQYYDRNMIRPVYELVQTTGIKDTSSAVVSMRDYYEYYQLNGDFSAGSYMQHDSFVGDRLTEVFRFPVPEDHLVEITVTKDEDGRVSFSMDPVNGEPAVYGVTYSYGMAEDGFYILIHNQGLDCSEFKDGYGIYKVPMSQGELTSRLYLEEMHNCYPLDPQEVTALGMMMDHMGERMLLFTHEQGELHLTAIRLDTMEEEQTFVLPQVDHMEQIKEAYFASDFIVLELMDRRLALITLEEQWEIQWVIQVEEELYLNKEYAVMAEKDGKLAMVTTRRPKTWDRMAYVTVFDEEGLQFAAEYKVEGDPENTREYNRHGTGANLGQRYNAMTLQNKTPFELRW